EGAVPHVMEEDRSPKEPGSLRGQGDALLAQGRQDPLQEVERPQRVAEAGVLGPVVGPERGAELPDAAEPLELAAVHQAEAQGIREDDEPVHGIHEEAAPGRCGRLLPVAYAGPRTTAGVTHSLTLPPRRKASTGME